MKEFVFRRGGEGRSAQKRAECRSWREQFHAAELIRGGERSWISAAVRTMSPAKRSKDSNNPELWGHYTREEIPALFGFEFNMAIWNSGFVKLPGHMYLLVTLEKGGLDKSFKYQDKFLSPNIFQ